MDLDLLQSETKLSLQQAMSSAAWSLSICLNHRQITVSQSHSSSIGQFRHRRYDWIIHRSVTKYLEVLSLGTKLSKVYYIMNVRYVSSNYLGISLVIVANKGEAPAPAWSPLHGEVDVSDVAILLEQWEQILETKFLDWQGRGINSLKI